MSAPDFAAEARRLLIHLRAPYAGDPEPYARQLILAALESAYRAGVKDENIACEQVADPEKWAYKTCNAATCLLAVQGAIMRRREPRDKSGDLK